MIYLDNGISVYSGREYRCDPRTCARDCINLVSHGHFDHVPTTLRDGIICSEITRAVVQDRSGRRVECGECADVTLLDSGHVPGSTMFLINGDLKVLYTGDFSTRKKYFSGGAKAEKASTLIMESTFGKEKYVFPPTDETIQAMRDWVEDNAAKDLHSIIYAYTFGKAQEVIASLEGFDVFATPPVMKVNKVLERFGHDPGANDADKWNGGAPAVIVGPSSGRNDPLMKRYIAAGARTASVSGWALDSGHKYSMRVDTTFPLSDHADYEELLNFVRDVSPDIVYTFHGYTKELARDIRDKLDIEAVPLKKKHLTLSNFT